MPLIRSETDFGPLIRHRRKTLDMPQETLAAITGIAQSNLSRIERGQTVATVETYLRLLSALGVDLKAEVRR